MFRLLSIELSNICDPATGDAYPWSVHTYFQFFRLITTLLCMHHTHLPTTTVWIQTHTATPRLLANLTAVSDTHTAATNETVSFVSTLTATPHLTFFQRSHRSSLRSAHLSGLSAEVAHLDFRQQAVGVHWEVKGHIATAKAVEPMGVLK